MLKTSQTIPSSAYRLRELLFRRIHTLRSKLRRKEMALCRDACPIYSSYTYPNRCTQTYNGSLRSQNRIIVLRLALTLNIQTTIRCAHDHTLYRRTSNIGFCTLSDNGFENKEMQVNLIPWEPEKVMMKRVHCGACD